MSSLEPFDLEKRFEKGKHYSVFCCASRNSGKSTLLISLVPFFLTRYDFIVFVSNSLNAPIYSLLKQRKQIRNRIIFLDNYQEQLMDDLFRFQRQTGMRFDVLVVFDDCVSTRGNRDADGILQMFVRGRNTNISIFFCSQSPMFINSNARFNIDYLLLLKLRTQAMHDRVTEHFLDNIIHVDGVDQDEARSKRFRKIADFVRTQTEGKRMHHALVVDFLGDLTLHSLCADLSQINELTRRGRSDKGKKRRRRINSSGKKAVDAKPTE